MMAAPPPESVASSGLVLGQTAAVQALNALVAEIAKTDIPVLLVGESGTGKEVYARRIHRLSGRDEVSLKKVNCASLGVERLLAEIGQGVDPAAARSSGSPETLFLDGVHELDGACQRILLSLLPDGEPFPKTEKAVGRLIASTSKSLEKEVGAGRFRGELYFRISGVVLRLPPLRERKEDIPALLEFFLFKHSRELKKNIPNLSSDTLKLMSSHDWPGNIRELENLTRKIIAVGDSKLVLGDLRSHSVNSLVPSENWNGLSLKVAARAASRRTERELILQALERTHWNRKRAARELQISYKALLYKIKQIGVTGSEASEL
jgi:two-component system response regulator AtoC